MNIRTSFPLLLILLVTISLITTQPASAVARDHGASAFGEGAFSFFNGFRLEQWSYSFEAVTNPKGQVHGRAFFEIADTSIPIVTHVVVKINCLNVQGLAGKPLGQHYGHCTKERRSRVPQTG